MVQAILRDKMGEKSKDMMRRMDIFRGVLVGIVLLLLFAGVTVLGACAELLPPGTQPASTLIADSYSKQSGDLTVKMITTPNPPVRGVNTVQVLLTGANGQAISDAKVSFDVDMTNMSHGQNIVAASPSGEGRYTGRVNFLMPGPWRIIVRIQRETQTDTARFDFMVNFS